MLPEEKIFEYKVQELYTERDGQQIYGVVSIPQGTGRKMPAVVFSHGFGGSHKNAAKYAQVLAEKGYVTCCFDFCGGSSDSRSGGSTLEMSVFTELADLEAVIARIQKLDYVDNKNLFLIGTSQGGVVSAAAGAVHADEIRGMILIYPAFVMADDAKKLFRSRNEIPDSYFLMGMTVGRGYFEPLLDYDIYGAIAAYDKDVLIIHGDADRIVPISYSKHALDVYSSAELKVIPGAGHGFYGNDLSQAADWILQYLQSHCV